MKSDPTAIELLDLLRQSREYTQYFAELGVETIALSNDRVAPKVAREQSRTLPAPSAGRAFDAARHDIEIGSSYITNEGPFNSYIQSATSSFPFWRVGCASFQVHGTDGDVWRDIGDCTRCGLCEGRTQVVNTFGNHKARLMFVGEAPGADEDAQGKPFVGRAGQLLTKIIEAIGLKREDVLIGNVNRCRPPGNRQPTLEEAAICRPFLFREIAAVQPDVIVVMGNTALRNLLEVREGITRVRGKFQDFRGIKVMPTFHPAYLLRDPSKKRETWEDLKKVRDYLDRLSSGQD